MFKMGSHRPFEHSKHRLWPKERSRVKLAVWLPTTKVGNRPNFLACRRRATYGWKDLDEGYNFALDRIPIEGLHKKLFTLKIARVLVVGISGLPLGSPKTKSHLDVAPMERHRYNIRGKVVASPKVQAVVSLVCPSCLWLILAPKVLQLCTNHFVLVLCRSMWVIEACHFFLVPSWSSNMPLYPFIVLWAKECAPSPCSFDVFSLGFTFESVKELGLRHIFMQKQDFSLKKVKIFKWTKKLQLNFHLHS
jgi:hypothetical protein